MILHLCELLCICWGFGSLAGSQEYCLVPHLCMSLCEKNFIIGVPTPCVVCGIECSFAIVVPRRLFISIVAVCTCDVLEIGCVVAFAICVFFGLDVHFKTPTICIAQHVLNWI